MRRIPPTATKANNRTWSAMTSNEYGMCVCIKGWMDRDAWYDGWYSNLAHLCNLRSDSWSETIQFHHVRRRDREKYTSECRMRVSQSMWWGREGGRDDGMVCVVMLNAYRYDWMSWWCCEVTENTRSRTRWFCGSFYLMNWNRCDWWICDMTVARAKK